MRAPIFRAVLLVTKSGNITQPRYDFAQPLWIVHTYFQFFAIFIFAAQRRALIGENAVPPGLSYAQQTALTAQLAACRIVQRIGFEDARL